MRSRLSFLLYEASDEYDKTATLNSVKKFGHMTADDQLHSAARIQNLCGVFRAMKAESADMMGRRYLAKYGVDACGL